jgi:hypothetical protein
MMRRARTSFLDTIADPTVTSLVNQVIPRCSHLPSPTVVHVDQTLPWPDVVTVLDALDRCTGVRTEDWPILLGRHFLPAAGASPDVLMMPVAASVEPGFQRVATNAKYAIDVRTAALRS